MCLAQSKGDAESVSALGNRHVLITGDLKLDVPAPPADRIKLERLMSMTHGRPIMVAASSHPGEEEIGIETIKTTRRIIPRAVGRSSCRGIRSVVKA